MGHCNIVNIEKRAGEVRNAVESQVSNASTRVEGKTVEITVKGAEIQAQASEDYSELKTAMRKNIQSKFEYDIDVVIAIDAER